MLLAPAAAAAAATATEWSGGSKSSRAARP